MSVCPSKVLYNSPSFFHSLTVLSNELDAINNPDGENIAFVVNSYSPKRSSNFSSDSKFQILIIISSEVVTI